MGNKPSTKHKTTENNQNKGDSKSESATTESANKETETPVATKEPKKTKKAKQNPIELGTIDWYYAKDYEMVLNKSKETNKPILILFQEIPGCSTCKNYGKLILSNKEINLIINEYFIPIAIYNNRAMTKNDKILKKFNEPSWNNPVVRIIDYQENNIVKRLDGPYTIQALKTTLQSALNKLGIKI